MALEEAIGVQVENIDLLITKLTVQQNEMFYHSDVKMELTNLHEDGLMTEESFKDYVPNFCAIAVQYIQEWNGFP
jgi:hypothetical protein